MTVLVSASFTEASRDIEHVPINLRGCLFYDESSYLQFYTHSDCLLKCRMMFLVANCNCTPFNMPNLSTVRTCHLKDVLCLRKYYCEHYKWLCVGPYSRQHVKFTHGHSKYRVRRTTATKFLSLTCCRLNSPYTTVIYGKTNYIGIWILPTHRIIVTRSWLTERAKLIFKFFSSGWISSE